MKFFVAVLAALLLSACSAFKVVDLDSTGHFPTQTTAKVVLSKPVDLDSRKALILVPPSDFEKGLVGKIGYFDEVMTFEDLEKKVVAANMGDRIPSVRDRIGINNAAKHLKPFLWLKFERKGTGNDRYARYTLIDAKTMEDYFAAETHLDYVWTGVNDQHNWYPMFNALIDYIRENSKTYRR